MKRRRAIFQDRLDPNILQDNMQQHPEKYIGDGGISPKISLIVPVFNVEKYIEKCLDSVTNQTLTDIEIIIIDDGSTDNSIAIAREYQQNDNRIKIITHRNNRGLLQARRTGVFSAKGKYIQHLDADDWIDTDACEIIYTSLVNNECDICHIGIKIFKEKNTIDPEERYFSVYNEKINNKELLERIIFSQISHSAVSLITEKERAVSACTKMKNIGRVTFGEDIIYAFLVASAGDSCICINRRLYNYRAGEGVCDRAKKSAAGFVSRFKDIRAVLTFTEQVVSMINDHDLLIKFKTHKAKKCIRNLVNIWRRMSLEDKDEVLKVLGRENLLSEYWGLLLNFEKKNTEKRDLQISHCPENEILTEYKKKTNNSPEFNIYRCSDRALELTHYWYPPVSALVPSQKLTSGSSLRVAAIVDERLFRGFRHETELLILTPANWRRILSTEKIDFLLIESCWQTITGHWYLGQSFHDNHKQELLAIVSEATRHAIPTVYWNTWNHLYHSFFSDFAKAFDLVFCADPKEVELFRVEGFKAFFLPPAVQPAIHNSRTRRMPDQEDFSINVLFDGYTDIERLGDQLDFLNEIRPYGLRIVESRAQVFTTNIRNTPLLKECFLGSVSYQDWLTTVKCSNILITLEKTLHTKTWQQWQTLEAIACGAAVFHLGELDPDDIRWNLVWSFSKVEELLRALKSYLDDDAPILNKSNRNQQVCKHHSFRCAIQKICEAINISNYATIDT